MTNFYRWKVWKVRKLTAGKKSAVALLLATALLPAGVIAAEYQSLKEIRDAAVRHIEDIANRTGADVSRIDTGRLDPRLRLGRCEQPLTSFSPYDMSNFTHRSTVGVRCEGAKPWTVYVPVTVVTEVEVLTLARPLKRGDIISRADVTLTRQTHSRDGMAYLNDPADAIGKQITRSMGAGTTLLAHMIANPLLVRRGDTVPVVVAMGRLQVRSTAEALNHGSVGDVVRLNNPRSGRTVEGRVQTDGTIAVRH